VLADQRGCLVIALGTDIPESFFIRMDNGAWLEVIELLDASEARAEHKNESIWLISELIVLGDLEIARQIDKERRK